MDKEMMRALEADGKKLRQLTGQDHGPVFLGEPPLEIRECEACDGRGWNGRTIHVYEPGCGFSHPDAEEVKCEVCDGAGVIFDEAEGHPLTSGYDRNG